MLKTVLTIVLLICTALMPQKGFGADEEFVIGLIPEENIFKQMIRYKPLESYLAKKLGKHAKLTILSRYPDIIDRFVTRDMDAAFFGIFTSIIAFERLGVEPIARPVYLDGSTTAKSYIFVRKNSGIRNASNMRGKKAVFVDKATATGYLYLLAYLRENGINDYQNFFKEYTFVGSHDTSVYSVLSGKADIGVAKGRILEKLSLNDPLIKDELLIISQSEVLPDITLCIKSDTPAEIKKRLKEILLSMHKEPEGIDALKSMDATRFAIADKSEFDSVYKLAAKAGITDLKAFDYK